jgi:hypothetical protein
MNVHSRGMRANPRVVGFLVLVGSIFLAYEIGQWVLGNGFAGLGARLAELVGIPVALAILVRWRMGILLFLFWLTFEDLIRKYAGGDMKIFFVKDVLLAVVYAAFFFAVMKGREKLFRPQFWVPMLALVSLAVAQVFNPRSTSIFYGLLGMKLDFYYVPLIFLGYALLRTQDDLERFLSFSLKTAILVALVGVAQGLGWKTFLNPANLAPQFLALGHLVRFAPGLSHALSAPPSVFVSQGRYANYLALMSTLALGVVAYAIFRRRPAKLVYLAIGVLGVAIFLAGSKGAVIYALLTLAGLGIGLLWGTKNQPWISARLGKIMRRSVVTLALGLLAFFYLFPNLAGAWSTYYYEMLWPDSPSYQLAIRTGSYPLDEFEKVLEYNGWQWGYGTGTASIGVQYVTSLLKAPPPPASPVENGFGDLIIEWGILGPILWALMAITLLIAGWKVTRRLASTPLYPLSLAILWYVFWVLLPFMWSGPQTYQNYVVNAYLWLLVGILFRLPALVQTPGPQSFTVTNSMEPSAEPLRAGSAS